jgi:AcrR family transcriptional regulator
MRDYDGKTAAQRVAERRERLIDAGFVLFGEHGYAGTSIRAVLRQSGLRDRYFAESFDDLDSLLAAVHARLIAELVAKCRTAIDATKGPPSEGARAMIEVLTRSLESDEGRARIKLREVLSAGPVSRAQRRKGNDELAGLVAELLPAGSTWNRQQVGLSIVAAADELLIAWLDGQQGVSRKSVVNLVMLLFDAVTMQMAAKPARATRAIRARAAGSTKATHTGR